MNDLINITLLLLNIFFCVFNIQNKSYKSACFSAFAAGIILGMAIESVHNILNKT